MRQRIRDSVAHHTSKVATRRCLVNWCLYCWRNVSTLMEALAGCFIVSQGGRKGGRGPRRGEDEPGGHSTGFSEDAGP